MVTLGTIGFFFSIAIIIYLVISTLLFGTFTTRGTPQTTSIQTTSIQGRQVMIPPRGSATAIADCPTGTVVKGLGILQQKALLLHVSTSQVHKLKLTL